REPAADDLLGHALARLPAVNVGGVEEVEAAIERAIHDREAFRLGGLGPEVHRAETEPAHLEARATELHVFHRRHPPFSPLERLSVLKEPTGGTTVGERRQPNRGIGALLHGAGRAGAAHARANPARAR